jgi:hypothetical protein
LPNILQARRHRQRHDKERARSGGARQGNGDRKGGRGGSHEDDREDDDTSCSVYSDSSESKFKGKKGKFYNCGVCGHFAEECPKKRKEQALLAMDDEPCQL